MSTSRLESVTLVGAARGPAVMHALLVLAVAFTAGIHAALVPEHLAEMPRLGDAFIVAAAAGGSVALALLLAPASRRMLRLAALFLTIEIVAWVGFVTVPVPGFDGTPESVEAIAVVCKAIELLGVLLALGLLAAPTRRRRAAAH
ncbi:MAG TPA: hypothetical protein VFN87_03745 [Solirubrobacteraceae bacterium]|nr:hypothetical protein [Solirubrobacteraceae bacterium]